MNQPEKFSTAEIKEELPGGFGDFGPRDLIGSKLWRIGSFVDESIVSEGGFVVDYETTDGKHRRAVFSFNDSGMWVTDTCDVL